MLLREPREKDAQRMLSWMHAPETKEIFANNFASFTLENVMNFIKRANEDDKNKNFVCVDDNDNYLGTVSLKNINYSAKNAEYAISFCPDAHGTGAAKFATDEILKYAFETLELERVYLNVIRDNMRANKFYKKMGFVFEGEFRNHILINGKMKNLCWYSILKQEFFIKKKNSACKAINGMSENIKIKQFR